MDNRKVHYIDASKMSEQELAKILNLKIMPWYKDLIFWTIFLAIGTPSLAYIIGSLLTKFS